MRERSGASMHTDQPPEWISARLELKVLGQPVRFEIPVSTAPARPADLLPQFRAMGEALVGFSVRAIEADGQAVSCTKGCGACCRQMVPVTEVEARMLRDVVAGMPEPRQTVVLNRFASARERLTEAGLLDRLMNPEKLLPEDVRDVSLSYFQLHIACPFLEDESCSIYEDRPIACREYLVTSPAANCATPSAETVKGVPVPIRASHALARLGTSRFVPLTVAPEWAENHPDVVEPRPGPEILRDFIEYLVGRKIGPVGAATPIDG
jgi:Fe-S-cluster containining protein